MFVAGSKSLSTVLPVGSRPDLPAQWKAIVEPVEPFLDDVSRGLAEQVDAFDPEIRPYAEYALNGHGKHLRPALVGLTARSLGEIEPDHVTISVIIEMVHLATLVHDDIMDEAEIRRGKLTVASRWGNEVAVLFGDCMFAQALTLAAGFPTPEVCRAVAMATNTVCSGEILQTRHRGDFGFSRERYFKVLEMKTGELFALSCSLSAFLSPAGARHRQALRQFGLAFGTAYQVYDDCMDVFGNEASAGKSLGTDLTKGKLTLPVLLAWDRASAVERLRLEKLVQDWQTENSKEMLKLLVKHDTLRGSREIMKQYLDTARDAVKSLGPSRSGLVALTEFLAAQANTLGSADGGL
jgi:octaprenyl-diphosphate synthase